ncbi:DMT family transporter [Aliikangiella sp. IMCC44632]
MNPKVSAAYLLVVAVWSTTPLAIQWSSDTIGPILAVLLRMVIAAILGLMVIYIRRIKVPFNSTAILLYSYSGIGIFIGMTFAYLAASYLTSGLLSLIWGLAPLISGLMAQYRKQEAGLDAVKLISLLLAVVGLAVVVSDNLMVTQQALPGVGFALCGVTFFSLSSVLVKGINIQINPIATTVGALLLTLPLFFVTWLILEDFSNPQLWSDKAIYSIVYLGVFGSLIGFVAYYYILQKLSVSSVAIITLLTPVVAILLGSWLNNELISLRLIFGGAIILVALACFFWGKLWFQRLISHKHAAER